MTNTDWDLIRAIHSDKTGIPPHVVDYIAVYDILKQCVSGKSVDTIAVFLEFTSEYVVEVSKKFLFTEGWSIDLSINPYQLYLAGLYNMRKYKRVMQCISSLSDYDIMNSFRACYLFNKIEQELKTHEYFTNAS